MATKTAAARVPELKIELSPLEYLQQTFDALGDYVLIVPIEKPLSDEVQLEQSDHFKEAPTWGTIAAIAKPGEGRYLQLFECEVGDEVYFTKYAEDVEFDGRKAKLVHGSEVKIRRRKR